MGNTKKNYTKPLFFVILQIFLYAFFIFLTISVSLNASFIIKLDSFVFKAINLIRSDFINNLMLIITFFGESIFYIIALILILLLCFKKRKKIYPLVFITILSATISSVFKEIIARSRPIGEFVTNLIIPYNFPLSYSFPSGHTQTSLVFYFILTYILVSNINNKKLKHLFLSLSIVFALLIMLSRVILGVHFFSDVLAGLILGIIIITNYMYFKNYKN